MSATTASAVPTDGRVESPPIVYFWGPVRAHVNRVAAEYALRLDPEPVWLEVQNGAGGPEPALDPNPIPRNRRYVLAHGSDGHLHRLPEPAGSSRARGHVRDRAADAEEPLELPAVIRTAVEDPTRTRPRSAFVLSNIDQLPRLATLLEPGTATSLLHAFHERNQVLVLTSEGLLPLPHLDFECAFEVSSVAEEEWWEAEVRPGVPVSACASCGGATEFGYASCAPEFRMACPVVRHLEPGAL